MSEREIFIAARELADATDQAAYLDRACAGDAALRKRVEQLLLADAARNSILDAPPVQRADSHDTEGFSPARETPVDAGKGKPTDHSNQAEFGFLAPPDRPDALGRLGHYHVLEYLGRGSSGIVFRAFDDVLKRVVALKVLAPQLAVTSPARKRFLREATSAAAVRHENVVQVYAVEENPVPYLVMELIPGETLQQRLDRVGPLDATEVVHTGRQIAAGLAAAHDMGLIHRDVTPANVLLERGPQARVKLTDFGLARAADDASLTQSGYVAGTPMYMSPEQARGEPVDHRTDLFSLGSVLYVMTSGRPPFRASNSLAVLKRVNEDVPRPIPEIVPEAPAWLCDLIGTLQAKERDERIQSAREVAERLECGMRNAICGTKEGQPSIPNPKSPVSFRGSESSSLKSGISDLRSPASERNASGHAERRTLRSFGLSHLLAATAVFLLVMTLSEATGVTQLRGTIVRFFTSEGTLVVESDDPEVSVSIEGEDLIIVGAGVKELRVKPGNYKVLASKEGKVVSQQLVTITKNGKEVVRISRESLPAARSVARLGGPGNYALQFDGVSAYVTIQSLKRNVAEEPLTIEAWVKPDLAVGHDVVVVVGGAARCQIGRNGPRWAVNDVPHGTLTHQPALPREWMHLAYCFQGATMRVFANGKLIGSKPAGTSQRPAAVNVDHAWIGAHSTRSEQETGYHFLGMIDEVRISKTARYEHDFTPEARHVRDDNTLALYHCDEGSGDRLADSSGNDHHGKIVGAKWVK